MARFRLRGSVVVRFYCRTCKRFSLAPIRDGSDWRCGACDTALEPEAHCDPERVRLQYERGQVVVIPDVPIDDETGRRMTKRPREVAA